VPFASTTWSSFGSKRSPTLTATPTPAPTATPRLSIALQAFLKAANATTPQLDLTAKRKVGHHFDASGSTDRTERLTATVPAIVRKVLPNGNLFVEGHRWSW